MALLKESRAETVKLKTVPALRVVGAVTPKWVREAALTATVAVPEMLVLLVSVAVKVRLPAVTKVTPLVKIFWPASLPEKVKSPGAAELAPESLLVKWTVPLYAVLRLLKASRAE